jgi:hypothetical protein
VIVVIQCAARKSAQAGYFQNRRGQKVLFVARPDKAPQSASVLYARPDDASDEGPSWRDLVLRYNETHENNPFGLLPAITLYAHPAYQRLADAFGRNNVYVLSAGWGLISANFLTPAYDITFSPSTEPYKRRRRMDRYDDFRMLPADVRECVCFIGGKDYVPLFVELTKAVRSPRFIFYNSVSPPNAPGCTLKRFDTNTRTNWHYECAQSVAAGDISRTGIY